jgi:hypothetical protein
MLFESAYLEDMRLQASRALNEGLYESGQMSENLDPIAFWWEITIDFRNHSLAVMLILPFERNRFWFRPVILCFRLRSDMFGLTKTGGENLIVFGDTAH